MSANIKRPRLIFILGTCAAVQASLSWALFVFPPIAAVVAPEFGLNSVTIAYQTAIMFATQTIATLYSGAILARLGAVRGLQFSILMALMAVVLFALPSVTTIVIGSVCMGISHCLINLGTALILRQSNLAGKSGFIFSVKQASTPVGFFVSSLLGPALAASYGWRWSLLPLAVLLVLLLFVMQTLMRSHGKRGKHVSFHVLRVPLDAVRAVFSNPPLLWCACGALFFGITQNSLLSFSSNMLVEEFNQPLIVAGYVLSGAVLGAMVARIIWGYLADRMRDASRVLRKIAYAVALFGTLIAFMPLTTPALAWGALYILLGATVIAWNGLVMSEMSTRADGRNLEQQMAGSFFIMFLSGSCGSLLFTLVHAWLDSYAYAIAGMLIVFSILAAVCFRTRRGAT